MNKVFASFVFCLSFSLIISSCFDEEVILSSTGDIEFSVDTLRFDTVFTTVGSATRQFKIFNRSSENVTLQSVRLAQEGSSSFRINVDGISADRVEDIFIRKEDSIYVFVEVTVDPDEPLSVSPFVITEDLLIESNDGVEVVKLESFGQNANYFPSKDSQGNLVGLSCNGGTITWDDEKPYVIYGLLFIDSCSLVISPGTDVYVHGGFGRIDGSVFNDGGLFFLENGNLNCQGTIDQPITFQGDRLESEFDDTPGQWSGIRFLNESKNNTISHATIKNSIVGVRVDSAAELSMNATQIYNSSNVGVLGVNGSITADNCLIYNSGAQSVAMVSGGDYNFRYCTVANYLNQAPAMYMDNFSCLDADCQNIELNPLKVHIENSIVMGSNIDELQMVDITEGSEPASFDVQFRDVIIRVDELKESIDLTDYCDDCIEFDNQDLFIDADANDYHLDTMSVALGAGHSIEGLTIDIDAKMRDAMQPDLGCYEF